MVLCHSGSGPCRVSGGWGLPKGKLDDTFAWSRLSSNFMWRTGTVVTSHSLGKRTDIYI